MDQTQCTEKLELSVYFTQCPEHGPEHRFYRKDEIKREGGRRSLERKIERETISFCFLGRIAARECSTDPSRAGSWTFSNQDLANLPPPGSVVKYPGRLNPAHGQGKRALNLFDAIFEGVRRHLHSWEHRDSDGFLNCYAVKEVKMDSERIRNLARSVVTSGAATEIVQVTILKYWDDPDDPNGPTPILTDDLILGESPVWTLVDLGWDFRKKRFAAKIRSVTFGDGAHRDAAKA
jgi:hypothetical protein